MVVYKGITYLPVAWPQHLATLLLKRAHIINNVLHLRRHRLEQHLKPFFFIRNFNKMFDAMTCDFCLHNLKDREAPIPLGLTFNVSQSRSFLSIDICVVNSKIEFGSFLNIVDICSYFCITVKCRATPTAQEVHEIIWTHWCSWGGLPSLSNLTMVSMLPWDMTSRNFLIVENFLSHHINRCIFLVTIVAVLIVF